MRKVIYHPGTSTYWSDSDEWYTVHVPDHVSDDEEESYLLAVTSNLTSHSRYNCPECGKKTLELWRES